MNWVGDNLDLIWSLTLAHLRLSAIPIVLGFVLAVPLGWLAFRFTRLRGGILSVVSVLYTVPSLGMFALVSGIFGLSMLSDLNLIVALTIYGVALMSRSVTDAFASVDTEVTQAARAIGFGPARLFFRVELPLAAPVLLAGLRVMAVSTVALVTVGILIGVDNLGFLFTNGLQRRIVPEVLAGVVMVAVIALVIDRLLVLLGALLLPKHERAAAVKGRES